MTKTINKSARLILLLALETTGQLESMTLEDIKQRFFPSDSIATLSRSISELPALRLDLAKSILAAEQFPRPLDSIALLLVPLDSRITDQTNIVAKYMAGKICRLAALLDLDPVLVHCAVGQVPVDSPHELLAMTNRLVHTARTDPDAVRDQLGLNHD